jgi:hypothetical protein
MPDGKRLFVVRVNPKERRSRLWTVSAESGEAAPLDLNVDALREPCVSPDGRLLAFTGGEPWREVWVASNFLPIRTATPAKPPVSKPPR